ncbi:gamma-glutamyltransferase, partial [Streptomyces sp. NPDC059627]
MRRPVARKLTVLAVSAAVVSVGAAAPPAVGGTTAAKTPVAVGYGGAVASVDADATAAGLAGRRNGGTAVGAGGAPAGPPRVTEPYSSGVGGGGYFVYYNAKSRTVHTIDGRETAPLTAGSNLFVENGKPLAFADAVSSGLSVGTPGTPATWQTALSQWGTERLGTVLKPAERIAGKGFVVDDTFRSQTAANETRFRYFPDTAKLFLPGGQLPVVGSTFKNPELARTYKELGKKGIGFIYRGALGKDIVSTVNNPPVDPSSGWKARAGKLSTKDLAAYRAKLQAPTETGYRGLKVYSIAPSSSGGTTVGEALNILENTDLSKASEGRFLADSIGASRLAVA